MGDEKDPMGLLMYQDTKGEWHPLRTATNPVPLVDFTLEDLWIRAEEQTPPESGIYIISMKTELPFDVWPVQIGWYENGEWLDMNVRPVKVKAWLPLPKPLEEGEADG